MGIGTGMVRWAHSSQLKIWTSVPQMAVRRILMTTSFLPGEGLGTSSSHKPCSRFALTSAFMSCPSERNRC